MFITLAPYTVFVKSMQWGDVRRRKELGAEGFKLLALCPLLRFSA